MSTAHLTSAAAFVASYYGRFKGRVVLSLFLLSIAILSDITNPIIMGSLVDTLIQEGPMEQRLATALWWVVALCVQGMVYHLGIRFSHINHHPISARVEALISEEGLQKVHALSTDWHVNSFAGSTLTKIRRASRASFQLFYIFCFDLYASFLLITGMVVLTAFKSLPMAAMLGIYALIHTILSTWISYKVTMPLNTEMNRKDNLVGGALADILSSNSTIKSFGTEAREENHFQKTLRSWEKAGVRAWNRGQTMLLAQSMLTTLFKAALFGGALWFWSQGKFTAGDVVFILTCYNLFSGYFRHIGESIRDLTQGISDVYDLLAIHRLPNEMEEKPTDPTLQVKTGEIQFKNIHFRYPGKKDWIYKNFSLHIHSHEKIALVGPSGGGKSTLIKLLERLYDVQEGEILMDGQDLRTVRLSSLRASLALVPQDPTLFHRSLYENIAYARPHATREEVENAAQKAYIHDFIQKLPDGYETLVGERGVKLSGGERQRVAIARAILADCPIIILDEATSSLDSLSEAAIQSALKNLLKNRTAILIAHRLSTIKAADRILVMDQGKIVEEGTHATLLKKDSGLYHRLFEMQAQGFVLG